MDVLTVVVTVCGKQVKKFIADRMELEYEMEEPTTHDMYKSYKHTGKQKCIFENVKMIDYEQVEVTIPGDAGPVFVPGKRIDK